MMLGVLGLGAAGCDLLYPPPSPPLPTVLRLDDPTFQALFVQDDPEIDTCSDRMDALYDRNPCERDNTARGETVLCALEAPLESLRFSCGPDSNAPQPWVVITPRPRTGELLAEHVQRVTGTCEPAPNSIFTSESPARWEGDRGELACLFSGKLARHSPGQPSFPFGLFLAYDVYRVDASKIPQLSANPAALPIDALRLETGLLNPEERDAAMAMLEQIMSSHPEP